METDRLFLRKFNKNDAVSFFEMNNDWDVIKYTGDKAFASVEAAANFIENYSHYQKYGYGRWAVCLKENGEFIGFCGLKFHPKNNITEVGFRFYKKYWNQGFATESATSCIAYGFNQLHLNKIYAHTHIKNIASQKVLEKCGLQFVKQITYDGHPAKLYCIKNETKHFY